MIRQDVSALWIGGPLGHLEQLALSSFRDHNFAVNLYTYDASIEAPEGVVIQNGEDILPAEMVFENASRPGTFSAFSNIFRYRLLQLRQTTWIDTDVVALGGDLPSSDYLFAWESKKHINGAVLSAPPNSPFLKRLLEQSLSVEPSSVQWGQLGPRLITSTVQELGLAGEATNRKTIYPLSFRQIWEIFDPRRTRLVRAATGASPTLHLWNEVMRNQPIKHQGPPPGSFLAELMDRHGVTRPSETVDIEWVRRTWRPQINARPFERGFLEQRAGRILRLLRAARLMGRVHT